MKLRKVKEFVGGEGRIEGVTHAMTKKVWSGLEFSTKPDQPGLSSSIRLKIMMKQS